MRAAQSCNPTKTLKLPPMLRYALTFLIVAIIAAALGFGGIAGVASDMARILFYIFLVLFVIALIVGRKVPPAS